MLQTLSGKALLPKRFMTPWMNSKCFMPRSSLFITILLASVSWSQTGHQKVALHNGFHRGTGEAS